MKLIKNLLVLFALAITFSLQAQTDAVSQHFSNYVEDEKFTVVYISPRMMDMIANTDDNTDKEAMEALKDLSGLRILTTEQTPAKYYKEAATKLASSNLESLMTIKSNDGENVNFFVRSNGDKTEELVLLVEGAEFIMLSMEGDINLKKVSKLAKALDIKGAEHLEELKNQ